MAKGDTLAQCCADLYGHPVVRLVMGNSLHPGGLRLTSYLAQKLDLKPGDRVLDAGCGWGATVVHLAKQFGCHMLGVSLEEAGIKAGQTAAQKQGVEHLVSFVQGDICTTPLEDSAFDAIIIECSFSIVSDKSALLKHCREALRPGGQLGITDITVNGELPSEFKSLLATAACIGDARPLAGYQRLMENAGFTITALEDLKTYVEAFLQDIKGKLLLAEIASKLNKLPVSPAIIEQAKSVLVQGQGLVQAGVLGYGLIVAQR